VLALSAPSRKLPLCGVPVRGSDGARRIAAYSDFRWYAVLVRDTM